jgi:hypothetical protein
LICDGEVQCEYPFDIEELVGKQSHLPPGESTKTSSSLALFKLARVLSKVLEDLYAVKTGQSLLFKTVASLQDALDAWSSGLAPHLRLHFEKDRPSADTIHSRAPILVGSPLIRPFRLTPIVDCIFLHSHVDIAPCGFHINLLAVSTQSIYSELGIIVEARYSDSLAFSGAKDGVQLLSKRKSDAPGVNGWRLIPGYCIGLRKCTISRGLEVDDGGVRQT